MCTLVTLHRPTHPWPLLLAANRDEMLARAWDLPARHWPDQPDIRAGRDRAAGGTWLGMNDAGLVAAVLNRPGSLGSAPGKRSRGDLPLLALAHPSAEAAASAIAALDAADYRTFNLVLADRRHVIFIRGLGAGPLLPEILPPGLHMITAADPDDATSPRIARHLPRFRAAPAPAPERDDWQGWEALLADTSGPAGSEINLPPRGGFGTVCACLIGLPAQGAAIWRFAPGPPDQAAYVPV